MTQSLDNFLKEAKNKEFATSTGTQSHAILQHIVIDSEHESGDSNMIQIIKRRPDLKPFFVRAAQNEAPIAGKIHGHFVSRRIDKLLINKTNKVIDFVDYKTDTTKSAHIDKYKNQIQEYAELLRSAYPEYQINGYILWLHDWSLDKII
jgi:ATP-dependent exoDNAse (exonuclease V) beta subunit